MRNRKQKHPFKQSFWFLGLKRRRGLFSLIAVAVAVVVSPVSQLVAQQAVLPGHGATSKLNMVASVNPIATDAGLQALAEGGNAVDAAIATALTLGVVDGFNSGIGGGCFILIRSPDGTITAIDGREMAPAAAHRDLYKIDGEVKPGLAQTGALASGVPGAVKAYFQAVDNFGNQKMTAHLTRAAKIAEEGFPVSQAYSSKLKSVQKQLAELPASAAVLLKSDGSVFLAGEVLRQPDLASTYRNLAEHGSDWYYKGPFAMQTAKWMKAHGGILSESDFANYKTVLRKPIRTSYRGFEIVGFPPPSSGGVHVAQVLNILEQFDLAKMHQDSPGQMMHVVAEAMKLAFADRAYWLGDPDFVKVPLGLVSKDYARELAGRINLNSTIEVASHGTPPNAEGEFFEQHTTHVAAADAEGYWVAITTTVNTTFGSKVIVPGLGVVMNNQMDDFSAAPGVRNSLGLVGAENNSIAAGKRPLSSMSPTIVLKNGQPVFSTGAAGGPKIITEVIWAIINRLDLKMSAADAIAQPRIHHQWSPDKLLVERTIPFAIVTSLEKAGHKINRSSSVGICQAISFDPATGIFVGAHDPRTTGKAAGTDAGSSPK